MPNIPDPASTSDCRTLLSALAEQITREKISIRGLIEIIEDLQEGQQMNAIAMGMLMIAIRDA